MAFHPTGGTTYYLGASIGSTDTTILLSSFLEPISGTPYTMALMDTTIAYGTIAPISAQSEFVSFTGIVQNADGTAMLTGVIRGLARSSPYATSATYKIPHAGQSIFILSDAPSLFNEYAALRNDNSFLGANTVPTPSASTQIANKAYVDLVAGGIATVNQLIIPGTAGESIVAGDVVYLKVADGFWWKADADLTATVDGVQLGISQGTGSAAVNISGGVLLHGIDSNQSGGTIGAYGYISNTPGKVATSAGTIARILGQFRSATVFDFDPNYIQLPTSGQKAALAGTSGTPSSSNKYVTNADTSTTVVASAVPRADASGRIAVGFAPQLLFTSPTSVTVGNTNTETTVMTGSVPANILGANNVVKGRIYISTLGLDSGQTSALNIRLKLGATTLASTGTTSGAGSLGAHKGWIDFTIMENAAINAQIGQIGFITHPDGTDAVDAANVPNDRFANNGSGTGTEDTTSAKTLIVSAQWSTSGAPAAGNTATFLFGYVEVIRQ